MPDILKLLRPSGTHVPTEVRLLQLAVAGCLEDIVIADEKWTYYTSLSIAKRLHEAGARMLTPT